MFVALMAESGSVVNATYSALTAAGGFMPTMKVSCQFATSLDSPQRIAIAETLGYDRAWLHDTPQQSPDVWMMLALAAERTDRIGLGPSLLVPAPRRPMV